MESCGGPGHYAGLSRSLAGGENDPAFESFLATSYARLSTPDGWKQPNWKVFMNLMLASGGYPWTVMPLDQRSSYVSALEGASLEEDIVPFADFLAEFARWRLAGEPLSAVPETP